MTETLSRPEVHAVPVVDNAQLRDEDHHSEIHKDTLGPQLVYDAHQTAGFAVAMDPPLDKSGLHRELLGYQDSLHVDLGKFRTFIREIPQSKRQDYGVAVYNSLPKFQQQAVDEILKEKNDDPSIVLDWLVERPSGDLRGKAQGPGEEFALRRDDYDQRILNFLQAHNENIKMRQQDPEFLQQVEFEKGMWLLGIQYGVDSGWLHPSAIGRTEELDSIKIYEGDEFSTYLQERAGYHPLGSKEVIIGKDAAHAVVHELNHALLDGEDPDTYKKMDAQTEEVKEMWEQIEALTEHAALVIRGELLDIEDRNAEIGVYNQERQKHLYGPVHRAQNIGVDLTIADFMRYYSAEGEDRVAYKQKIAEKIAEIERLEDKYLG